MKPIVVIEGSAAEFDAAAAELRRAGWRLRSGFAVPGSGPGDRLVCQGTVDGESQAAAALLAVLSGAGLIAHATAAPAVIDRLCEDLRHIGPLDHRCGRTPGKPPVLPPEHQQLVALLLAGSTLAEAADRLTISRRTADRRMADIRAFYAVTTRAAALRAARKALPPT